MEEEKKMRISKAVGSMMLIVAGLFGLLEFVIDFIPFIGQVIALLIDVVGGFIFALWFAMQGVKLDESKNMKKFWLPVLIGMLPIPVADAFLLPLGVGLTVASTQAEDKLGIKIPQKPTVKRPRNIPKV